MKAVEPFIVYGASRMTEDEKNAVFKNKLSALAHETTLD